MNLPSGCKNEIYNIATLYNYLNHQHFTLVLTGIFKWFKGGSRTGAPGARPRFEMGGGGVFVNLNGETRIYSELSQNTMFYSILLLQNIRYVCEGVSKQTPDLRILPRPPVLKFLDPQL